jgi:hypoxanthine phosphoribosyltransferase
VAQIQRKTEFTRVDGNRSWFGPALRTLRLPEFRVSCAELMQMVETDYRPTLVVGIRFGGYEVGESMVRAASAPVPILPITCRRVATNTKASIPALRSVLTALPRPALDLLRRVEHRLFIAPRTHKARPQVVDNAEIDVIADWLANQPSRPRVLVTDDAIDSGATLATVLRLVRAVCPEGTEIRSAVITQTLEQPIATPDYVLFHDTLCRFPWSFDAAA